MSSNTDLLLETLSSYSHEQEDADRGYLTQAEQFWKNLSYEDQLLAFTAVMTRVTKGELYDQGSYRYILYDIFGFGPESYGIGMISGFIDLHNRIER